MVHYHLMAIAKSRAPAREIARTMRELAEKVVDHGGVVRRIQHHGVRPLAYMVHRRDDIEVEHDLEGRFFTIEMDAQPMLLVSTRDMLFETRQFWRVMPIRQEDPNIRNWKELRRVFREERKKFTDEYESIIDVEKKKLKEMFEQML